MAFTSSLARSVMSPQERSQKIRNEGMLWGRRRHGGVGAEPPALENFAFFCKNNLIFRLF